MIIGLIGKAGSGKSTASVFLRGSYGFQGVGFADEIKMILYKMGLFTWEELWHKKTEKSRTAMQEFGEWVRKYDYLYWTEVCKEKIQDILVRGKNEDIVVDDVRRIDEAEMIRDMGGKLVRLYRDEVDPITDYSHVSETEMDEIIPDYVIRNNGSMAQLQETLFHALCDLGGIQCH